MKWQTLDFHGYLPTYFEYIILVLKVPDKQIAWNHIAKNITEHFQLKKILFYFLEYREPPLPVDFRGKSF